jgi:cysteinyl-tRNA synthetase
MSKSVGNVATMQEVLEEWGPEVTLLFFLTAHWRSPIDFSEERMESARARTEGLREVFRRPTEPAPEDAWQRFQGALENDFNTPDALAVLHDWRDHELLRRGLDLFGLASIGEQAQAPAEVDALAQRRQEARAARDFAESDRLREEIEAAGWEVRDETDDYRLVPRA